MNAPAFENLDLACAKAGKTIAAKPSKDLETLVTDGLAVLEEQGVYALFLYFDKGASGKEKKNLAKDVSQKLFEFLKSTPQHSPLIKNNEINDALQNLGKCLDNLLLSRDLLRQVLVYARYHTKMKDDRKKEQES
jgi:hypothetical protein